MGALPPERATAASIQKISRQVQMAVTEALRTLDQVKAVDPASQDEVDSLRSVVWSDLTGLEAEFGRDEGPRPELLNRFFTHLLSSGDHIGQIEALAGALLGGAPPPSQPPPDSPVAGLFRLHGTLASVRSQWQEVTSAQIEADAPAAPIRQPPPQREAAPPPEPPRQPPASMNREAPGASQNAFFDEMGLPPSRSGPSARQRPGGGAGARASESAGAAFPQGLSPRSGSRPPAAGGTLAERPTKHPSRPVASDRFFEEMGLPGAGVPGRVSEADTPRPRVVLSFVVVFVILALMGVGVIWLGLNGVSPEPTGIVPTGVPTFNTTLPTTAPQPTPTLSSAPPKLQVTGNPLIVPCPGKGTSGFVLSNVGGQRLDWSAKVNRAGGTSQPVTLNTSSGQLYGPANSGTDSVTVKVTANLANINGTITITTNTDDTEVITYHVRSC